MGSLGATGDPLDFGWTGVNTNADSSDQQADFSGPFVKSGDAGGLVPARRSGA